ncbi:Predicted ester cyclase [Haloferax larsenii]|uniref:Predicted ester cyclase n=2 Tax=Haloferax larsenii TaxID=302484 RepID=A0A1H7IK03_HALLR|nr:Predicted ester cyclase [Haloferax larsenii]
MGGVEMSATTEQEQQNRETAIRIAEELWNKGNYDVVDEMYDPLAETHAVTEPDELVGTQDVKDWAKKYHDAFSDFHIEVFDVIARDDFVYGRYRLTGTHDGTLESPQGDIPATNRKIDTWGMFEVRFEGGLVVEQWNSADTMDMMEQLGTLSG